MICNWYDVYIAIYMEFSEKSIVNDYILGSAENGDS